MCSPIHHRFIRGPARQYGVPNAQGYVRTAADPIRSGHGLVDHGGATSFRSLVASCGSRDPIVDYRGYVCHLFCFLPIQKRGSASGVKEVQNFAGTARRLSESKSSAISQEPKPRANQSWIPPLLIQVTHTVSSLSWS
jgi:hypothetical protein